MTDRTKPGVAFWATVVTVALFGLYVGAYTMMVGQMPMMYKGPFPGDPPLVLPMAPYYSATLPFGYWVLSGTDDWGRIFGPIHAVDRQIRPKYWTLRVEPRLDYYPPGPPIGLRAVIRDPYEAQLEGDEETEGLAL